MNQPSNRSTPHNHLPAELREVDAMTDRLGALDRAAAPAGLEDRLFRSTRARLAQAPSPIPLPSGSRDAVGSIARRVAAVVAVAGVLGLTVVGWRAVHSTGAGSSSAVPGTPAGLSGAAVNVAELRSELDRLFAATTSWSSGTPSALADLSSDVESFAQSNDPWSGADDGLEDLMNEDSL